MSDLGGPSTVPDLPPNGGAVFDNGSGAITDDERIRYLTLLDKALDRQLLDPYDYQLRVQELTEATSRDEMQRIVTELPAFIHPNARAGSPAGGLGSGARSRSLSGISGVGSGPTGLGALGGLPSGKKRSRPWAVLVAVVLVILVAFAVLAVFVEHEVHSRPPVTGPGVVALAAVSPGPPGPLPPTSSTGHLRPA